MQLDYDPTFPHRSQLTLKSGRRIALTRLEQQMTYCDLLVGVPSRESNDEHVGLVLEQARAHCLEGGQPYLIAPPGRSYLKVPGDIHEVEPGAVEGGEVNDDPAWG